MTLVLNSVKIPSIKLSKNYQDDEFLNSFVYHNHSYFARCILNKINKIYMVGQDPKAPIAKGNDEYVGIHYETGKWKWGSESMQNSMKRRGFIKVLRSDWNTSCLDATPKLVNKILNNIYRTLENIKCVKEGRYDDRNFTPCR